MSGVDLTTVKELLGHKSIQMTLRYAHLSQPHKKQAVETLTGVMGGHYLDTSLKLAASAVSGQNQNALISRQKSWRAWQDSNLRPTD